MSKPTLVWMDIPVTDLNRAIDFYAKVLAQPVQLHKMDEGSCGVLPGAGDAPSGCLAPADEDNQPSRKGTLVYISVNGRLDEAVRIAGDQGGEILRPKHPIGPYGYRAIIVDTEGNRIALHSETE